jgi:hypothetical protein
MGEGYEDRLQDLRYGNILISEQDESLITIPSYNEVMIRHRMERIPMWKKSVNLLDFEDAVHKIFQALNAIDELKQMADDYKWDDMQSLLRKSILTDDLEQACSILRNADFISQEARDVIGFDWGSCAWRQCGAEADAQESLAELFNLSGILEPFECHFILDVVERSIRDILVIIPNNDVDLVLTEYKPYPIKDAEERYSSQESEFLSTITYLRGVSWDEE